MKKATREFNPLQIGGWRLLGGAVTLALIVWVMRRPWPFRKRHIIPLIWLSVVGYVVPFVIQPWFIETAKNSSVMGMMISLTPIMTVLVAIPMLREYPTRQQVVGVVGGLLCLLVLMGDAMRLLPDIAYADLLMAASVPLCYAVSYCYIRRRFENTSAIVLACVTLTIGAAILLPIGLFTPRPTASDRFPDSPLTSMIALALLGIICTGLATFLFYWMLKQHGPLRAGMVSYIVPVVAILWGWVNGETITAIQIVAILGIMAMVALVRWRVEATPTL